LLNRVNLVGGENCFVFHILHCRLRENVGNLFADNVSTKP
jgi:hypothetical protein